MRVISLVKSKIAFIIKRFKCLWLSHNSMEPFSEDFFRNKRVAIIGGADSVLKEKLGEYIDSFDVVVRINKGVEIIEAQSQYVGCRTDVLFHAFYDVKGDKGSSPVTIDLWSKKNVGLLIFSRNYKYDLYAANNFFNFLRKNNNKLKYTQVPLDITCREIETFKPAAPTTGLTAIDTVFKCNPSELYLTGITFFKTPHNILYRDFNSEDFEKTFIIDKNHSADQEYQYVKKMYLENKHIIRPDKTLLQIFQNN